MHRREKKTGTGHLPFLSAAQADAFRQAIANHRRLEELLQQMRQLSEIALLGSAPGVKKRPRPTRPKPPLT
jgi:hypothetical protein